MNDDIKHQFWTALDKDRVLMVSLMVENNHAAPMTAIMDKDADGAIWFFTSRDNRIANAGPAMAQFVSKGHDIFACIMGTLTPETDTAVRDRHWSNMVSAWFPGGKDDPNLLMLRFDLADAEIWQPDLGIIGTFKMLTGAKIDPDQAGEHAKVTL